MLPQIIHLKCFHHLLSSLIGTCPQKRKKLDNTRRLNDLVLYKIQCPFRYKPPENLQINFNKNIIRYQTKDIKGILYSQVIIWNHQRNFHKEPKSFLLKKIGTYLNCEEWKKEEKYSSLVLNYCMTLSYTPHPPQ